MTASALEAVRARVHDAVGPRPVLLVGSRATGTARADSDVDVLVLLPLVRIPLVLGRLRRAAADLARELGVDVSVNPLPPSRLLRTESLFAWKIRREARVLWAPAAFRVGAAGSPPSTERTRFSLASSAALYLLRGEVAKALLHLAQVRLLPTGRYAATLEEAVVLLADPDVAAAAARTETEAGASLVRDLVVDELEPLLPSMRRAAALRTNARYALLGALRGRLHLRRALARDRVDVRLMTEAVALLRAPGGSRPDGVVAALLAEWSDAHPLGAQ